MDTDAQRRAVENYLLGLRAAELFTQELDSSFDYIAMSKRYGLGVKELAERMEAFGPGLLAELRRARVFMLEQSHAQRLLRLADEAEEGLLGKHPAIVPPFEVCFVSFGSGVEVTDYLKSSSGHYVRGLFIVSFLSTDLLHFYTVDERCVYEAGALKRAASLQPHGAIREALDRGPPSEGDLAELFGLGVLHDIACGPSVTAQKTDKALSREEVSVLGGAGLVPDVFYAVTPRPEMSKSRSEESVGLGRPRSWRHDVSGHWRMRVKRWESSVAEEDESKAGPLRKRGYVVLYPDEPPKGDVAEHLRARGLEPKTPFEFLAYRLTWIGSHVSPKDPSLPYVQGVRTA